jgi:hypothetical protein
MHRLFILFLIFALVPCMVSPISASADTVTLITPESQTEGYATLHLIALKSPVEGLILTYHERDFEPGSKIRSFQHATTFSTPDFQVIHDTGFVRGSDGEEWMYISQVVDGKQVVFILR